MKISGIVGPSPVTDGSPAELRFGNARELIVATGHGKYAEAVKRGNVYTGGTAATGVAPGTAIGTTAGFALHNPLGSKVGLSVLRATMGYVSGTMGAGVVHWLANVNTQLALPTGTAITLYNAAIGARTTPTGLAFTTATIATPLILRPFASLTALLATTADSLYQISEDVDGEFFVLPGGTLSLHATAAAGTSPLVVYGITIEEIAL